MSKFDDTPLTEALFCENWNSAMLLAPNSDFQMLSDLKTGKRRLPKRIDGNHMTMFKSALDGGYLDQTFLSWHDLLLSLRQQ